MAKSLAGIELRFLVPARARTALVAELVRGQRTLERFSLAAAFPGGEARHRTTRQIRTRGAVVKVALDEGQQVGGGATQPVRELEFTLLSGSTAALFALAERWRKRFGLIHEPRGPAERRDGLAEGGCSPPLRKARWPTYDKATAAREALVAVVDECLAQITGNAIGLCEGDPALRAEHVHQMRVGIRRLRSALRSFRGWATPPPPGLVDDLRDLFAGLGACRDGDVMDRGVLTELAKAGAPPLAAQGAEVGPNPVDIVRGDGVQRGLLAWLAWREELASPVTVTAMVVARQAEPAELSLEDDVSRFHRRVERRLRRWHGLLVADCHAFDGLDDVRLHELRKRIKRQRYATEFFAPVLRRRRLEAYLLALAEVQDRMGELNDLFVARTRFQALLPAQPAAWFALGWLAARITEARALTKPALRVLAGIDLPVR